VDQRWGRDVSWLCCAAAFPIKFSPAAHFVSPIPAAGGPRTATVPRGLEVQAGSVPAAVMDGEGLDCELGECPDPAFLQVSMGVPRSGLPPGKHAAHGKLLRGTHPQGMPSMSRPQQDM
jgi:hypothetical protein